VSLTTLRRERPAEPATGSGLPHRRLILAALALAVVAAVLTWLVAFSSVLGVRTVTVHGTQTLRSAQVRQAAAIANGTPLVRLDKAAVLHRVEALPDVASATVTTSFPSTVVITVTERIAVGYVRSGGDVRLVDRTGDQYRSAPSAPKQLPRFVVSAGPNARATGAAVATVAAAIPAQVRRDVDSIQALDPDAITLLMSDGRVVRWGSADRSTDKARILPALLRRDGTQFDVTDPDLPFSR
jgi:cell division protein FtsQ